MKRLLLLFCVVVTVHAHHHQDPVIAKKMIENTKVAIHIYDLESDLIVGEVNPENKRVVLCEVADEKALFDKLEDSPYFRRDRLPNTGHKGRIWSFRAKAKPSLHLTLVRYHGRHMMEVDIDRIPPSLIHFWNMGIHFSQVLYHAVTGKMTSQDSLSFGLAKLKVQFQNRQLYP